MSKITSPQAEMLQRNYLSTVSEIVNERMQSLYLVESGKYEILNSLRRLETVIGKDQVRAWIVAEYLDLA